MKHKPQEKYAEDMVNRSPEDAIMKWKIPGERSYTRDGDGKMLPPLMSGASGASLYLWGTGWLPDKRQSIERSPNGCKRVTE